MILPNRADELRVAAKTGANNGSVRIPDCVKARVHAASGLGKVVVDPQFYKFDDKTYQTPGYDTTASRVEITANTGAGNVIVTVW